MRILHLEDSVADAELIGRLILKEWPECSLSRVVSREEFQVLVKAGDFDLIVSDYSMGAFNGIAALEMAKIWCPEKPFIFMSGTIGEERAVEALKRGATDYVIKDRPARLIAAIRNALVSVEESASHKRTSHALRENRERFRQIAENVADLILLAEPDGKMLYANPAYLKAVGAAGDLAGSDCLAGVHPGDRAKVAETLRQTILSGEGCRTEYRLARSDGTVRHIEAHMSLIRDETGAITHLLSVARDMTERRAADERMREQAAYLDKAQDAIVVLDLSDRIGYWNKGAERVFGWTAAEAIGMDGFRLLDTNSERTAQARSETYAKGEWRGELRQRTRAGGEVTVQSSWTLVRSDEGRAESVLVINTDVTEKKRIEAQLLRSQRMESLGLLAGGIAHDLNNMLSPIITSSDLLKYSLSPGESERLLKIIESSAKHGAALVRQLLAFAKGAEGQHADLGLNSLLEDFANFLRPTLPNDVVLAAQVKGDVPHVRADATQIKQVLMNLCLNARDAMPYGGQISLTLSETNLDASAVRNFPGARPGRYVEITVADTGSGIAPDKIDQIFDPFFTTKEQGKGTGLGLSTVRGIVKGHSGFLSVESEVSRGTTFRILLPAATPIPAILIPPHERTKPNEGRGEAILLVDDEPTVRLTLQLMLGASGYRVFAAGDGREALGICEDHLQEVKLVITDLQMAGMDGLELIQHLREKTPFLPIIAISGLAFSGHFDVPLHDAGVPLLPKPIRRDNLLSAVKSALNQKVA